MAHFWPVFSTRVSQILGPIWITGPPEDAGYQSACQRLDGEENNLHSNMSSFEINAINDCNLYTYKCSIFQKFSGTKTKLAIYPQIKKLVTKNFDWPLFLIWGEWKTSVWGLCMSRPFLEIIKSPRISTQHYLLRAFLKFICDEVVMYAAIVFHHGSSCFQQRHPQTKQLRI